MNAGHDVYDRLAHLYDIAFDWDVEAEVEWLLERFGRPVRTLLEPACGSGRLFPPFVERGIEVVGVDLSPTMAGRARQRMRALALPEPRIVVADMADFALDTTFDGAFCAINSFGYLLTDAAAAAHLACVARHLRPGAAYLVQVDLLDTSVSVEYARDDCTSWEASDGETTVRCTWSALSFDAATCLQTESCRFDVLAGPDAGAVYEETHVQRKWGWAAWRRLIAASPFRLAAVYDAGDEDDRRPSPLDAGIESAHLTWHELCLPRSRVRRAAPGPGRRKRRE